jgi:hypothetical protein
LFRDRSRAAWDTHSRQATSWGDRGDPGVYVGVGIALGPIVSDGIILGFDIVVVVEVEVVIVVVQVIVVVIQVQVVVVIQVVLVQRVDVIGVGIIDVTGVRPNGVVGGRFGSGIRGARRRG